MPGPNRYRAVVKRTAKEAFAFAPPQLAGSLQGAECLWLLANLLAQSLIECQRRSIQNIQRTEMPVLQKLQRRAASGADVADFLGQFHLLDRRRAIPTADDRHGAF